MSRTVVALGLVVWAGMTLALAETRWARRISIARRLTTGGPRATDTTQLLADRAGAIGIQVLAPSACATTSRRGWNTSTLHST